MHIINNTITLVEVLAPAPDPYEGTSGIFNYSGWGYVTGNKVHGGNMGYYSKAGTVEFSNNEIEKSYTGFYSMGAEKVHHNSIKNCKGDGMILDGLRGPIYNNTVKDNAGSGIRITSVPVDLGGGKDNSPGLNLITGNGNFDMYVETSSSQYPLLYVSYNVWDHTDTLEVLQYDIRDGNDSSGLVKVSFTPVNGLGIQNINSENQLKVFPNPVWQTTTFTWFLSKRSFVSLKILDNTGRVIETLINDNLEPGKQEVLFDVTNLPAGVYFYRITVNGEALKGKVLVCR